MARKENQVVLIRVGNGSRRLPAIGRLPIRIRDRIFSRRFGLDRIPKRKNPSR